MSRPLLLAIALVATAAFPRWSNAAETEPKAEVIDGIAAIVNTDVITFSQVRDLVGPRERLLRSQLKGQELADKVKEARKAALQDLIDRQLIVQSFEKEKFEIPQHFVDSHMNDVIRESFGGDRNTFIKALQAQNYSLADFKKMERDKMIVQAMRGKNVKPATLVPPDKITDYYRAHRAEFSSKEEVKLRMIMIPGKSSSDLSNQKATAEELRAKVAGGAEFDRMARMYSEDSTRDLGGDWGWIERKTLAEPLEKVAFSLATGKVSNVVEVGGNYYILKVEDRRGGVARPMAEVRAEIEKRLLQEESQRLQERWMAGLRAKAYIRTF